MLLTNSQMDDAAMDEEHGGEGRYALQAEGIQYVTKEFKRKRRERARHTQREDDSPDHSSSMKRLISGDVSSVMEVPFPP